MNEGSSEKQNREPGKPVYTSKKGTDNTKGNQGLKTGAAVAGGVFAGNMAWGAAKEAKGYYDEHIKNAPTDEEDTGYVDETSGNETDSSPEESVPEQVSEADTGAGHDIEPAPVSDVDTGDMTFDEAFAAAREDVGPGGVFEWNGNIYGTYYKEEWEGLSPEARDDYTASVNAADIDTEHGVMPDDTQEQDLLAGSDSQVVDMDGDGYEESIAMDTNHDGEIDVVGSDFDMDGSIDTVVVDSDYDGDPDYIIQETNEEEVAELYEGNSQDGRFVVDSDEYDETGVESGFSGEDIEYEAADLDGDGYEESVLADTNNDGFVDAVASDTNMDGELDVAVVDTDYDGVADVAGADIDYDGNFDGMLVDTDSDGSYDEYGVDLDGDGELDYEGNIEDDLGEDLYAGNDLYGPDADMASGYDTDYSSDYDNDFDMSEWA